MNKFDEKLIEWSEQELNVKNCSKESLNVLRTKNGPILKKLLSFMSQTVKSKENGESMKRFCDSIKSKDNIKAIEEEIKDIESNTSRIRNQLIVEEFRRKSRQIKDDLNENKVFVSTLLLDVLEVISAKNKLCTQLKPNLSSISDIIGCYERLMTPFDVLDLENCLPFTDETENYSKNSDNILDQIIQSKESIEYMAYELNDMKATKPINISYDLELLSKSLTQSVPNIEDMSQNKFEKEAKNAAIAAKLISVQNLIKTYQTKRSEKLAKNKDKIQKVIHSCDEFIQQNV